MKKITPSTITLILMTFLMLNSCVPYRQWVPPQGLTANTKGRMEVLTRNGNVYRLSNGRFMNYNILGLGSVTTTENKTDAFGGSIPLDSIALVQVHREDLFAGLLSTASTLAVVVLGIVATAEGQTGVTVGIRYPPSSGGGWGSCPLAYSLKDDSLHLESETYVGAICGKLERTATDVLRHLGPSGDSLTLSIRNDSPETHLTNSVSLMAVDHPLGTEVVTDIYGTLHTVGDRIPCRMARDERGRDVTSLVVSRDSSSYTANLIEIDPENEEDLRDAVTVEFNCPPEARRAKLIVTCMNSDLADYALNKLFSLRGPSKLQYYHKLDNDRSEFFKLVGWMFREGGLEVSVWDNDHWVRNGSIAGVGGRVFGERIVLIDLAVTDSKVRVKLEGTSGLWKVDAVEIDYSEDAAFELTEAHLRQALTNKGENIASILADQDQDYFRTITDEWVNLSFDTVKIKSGFSRSYILKTTGHYFGWFEQDDQDNSAVADRILTEPLYGSKLYLKDWLRAKATVAKK